MHGCSSLLTKGVTHWQRVIIHSKPHVPLQAELKKISGVQIEMHAHWKNARVLKWCNQQGIHVSAYGPLSSPATMASMEKDVPNLMEVASLHPLHCSRLLCVMVCPQCHLAFESSYALHHWLLCLAFVPIVNTA